MFCSVFEGNFQVQVPGSLYLEGRLNGGVFALRVWEPYIWRGLYMEGLIYGIYGTSQESHNQLLMSCQSLYIPLLGYSYNPLSASKRFKNPRRLSENWPESRRNGGKAKGRSSYPTIRNNPGHNYWSRVAVFAPSMLILKNFLITLNLVPRASPLKEGGAVQVREKLGTRLSWNADLTLADIRDAVKFPEGIPWN